MFQQIVYDPPVKCRILLIDPVDIGFKKGKFCVISGQDHVIAGRRLLCVTLCPRFFRLNCGALRSSFAFLFSLPQSGSRKRQKSPRHILRIKFFKICLLSPVDADMPVFFRQILQPVIVKVRMVGGNIITGYVVGIPEITDPLAVHAGLLFQSLEIEGHKHCLSRSDKLAQLSRAALLLFQIIEKYCISEHLKLLCHLMGEIG